MKKIIILMIAVFALSSVVTNGQLHLKVGPKVGYDASHLSTSLDSISSQFKSGFQFGAFVRMGKKVYLQPELYYTTTGGVFTENTNTSNWKQNIKIGSLDVPILVGISFINSDLLNIRIHAGPVMSFAVNRTIAEEGSITGPIEEADIKKVNWYLQFGGGVDIWRLTLDVRYQVGLNKIISDVDYQNQTIDFNTSNNIWVVSLGFKFL
jgi:hypothetical protein